MSVRVAVLTPVFNGAEYLAECIESVLAQGYADFEYTILNNCSTDGTLDIAQDYAKRDRRIRVRTNQAFLSAIANHSLAVGEVSAHHTYAKFVSADDWIMPDCLGKMIALADSHPSVGVVGCYQRSGDRVRWRGVPVDVSVMTGREAARLGLLHGIHVLGTPTSVLYRADLLRRRAAFFPHDMSHADTSACYEVFRHADFGFVHEVLAVERVHVGQWTTKMDALDAGSIAYLHVLLQYGSAFLTQAEFDAREAEVFDAYYRTLGGCVLKLRDREFWSFHRSRLRGMGRQLEWCRVAKAAAVEIVTEATNPATAMRKVLAMLRGL